jgi:2-C-methyl-D-erythritol 4-phosphate cytidylyltransferase
VGAVPGDRMNLKVTFPEDVAIAEALLSARES